MDTENTDSGFFSKGNDLRNRILFTIFILIIYRLGTYVPIPGIDPQALKEVMDTTNKIIKGNKLKPSLHIIKNIYWDIFAWMRNLNI